MKSRHSAAYRVIASKLFDGLNSFAEIEARISALPGNKERGDAFEVFAEAYLATQKTQKAREIWPTDIPLEQRKRFGLPLNDNGIDGTFQTTDDEFRAYQVKFRSKRRTLRWGKELSTFMGLSEQFNHRVLFTNSESWPGFMHDRRGFIAIRGSDLDRLTPNDFESMRLWLQSGQVKLFRKDPRPHQVEALAAIYSELNDNDRATVVMACGTGKSLVALWAAEQRDCRNVLVLLPSLALVRQLIHEWWRETSWENPDYICVCSDSSVVKGADDLVVHQADLDFEVTTESAAVGLFLGRPFDGVKVVFSTYQSAHIVAEGMLAGVNGEKQPFDLAIFDEAHKTASRSGNKFSFALKDANLPIRKRLFFTATPRHYDIRKKDKEGDSALVYSMDMPKDYGRVAHTLSFAKAARDGIICDYKVVISVVTSEMLNEHALKHGEVIVAGDVVKARQVALQIALQKAVEKYGVSRIFTFHNSVAAAKSFTSDDGEGIRHHLEGFKTLHVSGEMRTAVREETINAFRQAEKAVISNARCLTEGLDVPAVDMVAFMSPRKSMVDIVQATGRAMRKSEVTGKKFGYVMVPLFWDTANETIEEAVRNKGFDDVMYVLDAMKEQDDVLTDIIRQMREEKGRTGGYDESRLRERVEVLGPSVSLEVICNSITAKCLESLGENWDERFGQLVAYKEVNGNCNVPFQWPDSPELFTWCSTQRYAYVKKRIFQNRIERLERIGFVWNMADSAWEEMFAALAAYKQTYGNCIVPKKWSQNPSLAVWVVRHRMDYREQGKILPERIKHLDKLGFEWDPFASIWDEMFVALSAYKLKYGDCNVPREYPENLKLARWCGGQRQAYRKKKLSPPKRIQRLEELGFSWNTLDDDWESMYAALCAYKQTNGDCAVPKRWEGNPELGAWCQTQRNNKKLSPERIKQLEDIGFEWDMLDARWEEMFSALTAYRQLHGDCNVPNSWEDNLQLGTWCQVQRNTCKNNKLSPERRKRLENIGFAWDSLDSRWEEMFAALVAYKQAHGNCNVPASWQENPKLVQWGHVQQRTYKKHTLSPERIQRLEEIGFVWERNESVWEERFAALTRYKQTYGNCNVPARWKIDSALGKWCYGQKKMYKEKRLLPERVHRLEQLGFVWDQLAAEWDEMFAALTDFQNIFGHCNVPVKELGYQKLSWWCGTQRKNNKLSQERISRLNQLGFRLNE